MGTSVTGITGNTEVIDLESPITTCKTLPNFPLNVSGAFGGLGFEDNPIICGGSDTSTSYSNKCYSLKASEWISSPDMKSGKAYAAVLVSPNVTTLAKLFVTGGFNSSSYLNTIDVLTPNGWKTLPQSLPINVDLHCSVYVNSTTMMIIGGYQSTRWLTNTYFFNINDHILTSGTPLYTARCQHSCGRIRKDSSSTKLSLIVAGGTNGVAWLSSVEILDEGSNNWRVGTQLPFGISASQMIEDPNGGVILVGGISDLNGFENSLYQIPHGGAGAVWTKMEQKLKIGRYWHAAFLVPDYFVECS